MNFFTRIAIYLYVCIILLVASLIYIFSLHLVSFNIFVRFFDILYYDLNWRTILAALSLLLILLNFIFYYMIIGRVNRDKIIAFDNPSGRVCVSLMALDDLIRRKVLLIPEVKELKSKIKATRRGLQVKINLVLRSEVNIPELTSKVQEEVTNKIQDTIGLEESVSVTIFVGKILQEKVKRPSVELKKEEPQEPNIPFQGYRA